MVAYHEVIEQGKLMVSVGKLPASIAIWAPFSLLAIFAVWRFYRTAFTLKPDRFEPLFDRLSELTDRVKSLFKRRSEAT